MAWCSPTYIPVDPHASPSLQPSNLACDGHGRFAFATGPAVQVTRRTGRRNGRADYTLAHSDDTNVSAVAWWPLRPFRPYLVVGTTSGVSVYDTRTGKGSVVSRRCLSDVRALAACGSGGGPLVAAAGGSVVVLDEQLAASATLDAPCGTGARSVTADNSTGRVGIAAVGGGCATVWMMTSGEDRPTKGNGPVGAGNAALLSPEQEPCWRLVAAITDRCVQGAIVALRGRTLAVGAADGAVTLYAVGRGRARVTATIGVSAARVAALGVHRERGLLVAAGEDGRVAVIKLPGAEEQECPEVALAATVCGVVAGACFSADLEREKGKQAGREDVAVLCVERAHVIRISAAT